MSSTTRTMLFLWTALLFLVPAALAAPTTNTGDGSCKDPVVRRNWHSLSDQEKDSFHSAVKCLQTKPSRIESDGLSKNLYDDFAHVHFSINQTIHKVAAFFPWHRYFLLVREKELQDCGYNGTIPYWDWTKDATESKFRKADIFDPEHGFGGDGELKEGPEGTNTTTQCVEEGPYAGLQVNYLEPHCLTRIFNISEVVISNWTKTNVKRISKYDDYINFWNETERQPHDNIHRTIGGDMRRQFSPNEPLFIVHHAQIDRIWTHWQGRNESRLYDYGGNKIQNMTVNDVKLDDVMHMVGLAEDRTVESLMDTLSNGLCYIYDD